jgi:hypothetical protein
MPASGQNSMFVSGFCVSAVNYDLGLLAELRCGIRHHVSDSPSISWLWVGLGSG